VLRCCSLSWRPPRRFGAERPILKFSATSASVSFTILADLVALVVRHARRLGRAVASYMLRRGRVIRLFEVAQMRWESSRITMSSSNRWRCLQLDPDGLVERLRVTVSRRKLACATRPGSMPSRNPPLTAVVRIPPVPP
jgi:hypothetical protein